MDELNGRTAVVTGGASGIGLATARALCREGMRVVLADVEEGPLAEAERALAGEGHEVLGVRTDVSKWDDVQRLADAAVDRFGAVHVVHNNAGVVVGGPVEKLSLADWEWVLGVDLWGVIHGVRAFLPIIEAQGEGHIVNTASTAGFHAGPIIGPYNVAKFGVVALTETLRRELEMRKSPVGASVLCPGSVATQIVESERNRPAGSAAAGAGDRKGDRFRKNAGDQLREKGLRPEDVAGQVVGAIRDGRFWIVTHPAWLDILRERVEWMADGGRLNDGFGG